MKTPAIRRAHAAGIVLFACAIVGGCSGKDPTAVDTTSAQPGAAPATTATSELESWAVSATTSATTSVATSVATSATATDAARVSRSAAAQTSPDALAAPVIHTVD
ncbi:hypothetical protein [Caballeronia sp. Lep1P3]|uniref:hypothetical protein n=1 Tax=Caballeronia sp. Lep1P3 TaxID=2878150 RepID=UPI001FD5985D|nr:hypothetical protein [Caballeronia sp. Lep1P3]